MKEETVENGGLVIARSAYGRTRFASLVKRGNTSRVEWTEHLDMANEFKTYEAALLFAHKHGITSERGECILPMEWARKSF